MTKPLRPSVRRLPLPINRSRSRWASSSSIWWRLTRPLRPITCTGYLTESWHDPRLVFSAGPGQPPARYYRKQDIWFPILQFDNSASPRTLSSYLMIGKPDGSVQYIEKFMVRLSSNMQLRAFPFDSQDLEIYVHPFTGQVGRIVLNV